MHVERSYVLTPCDADLQLDEIASGDRLGDAVLDLETRIHLEEARAVGADQELDGADAHVPDRLRQPLGPFPELREDGRGERRRRRLFEDLLVAALRRAVTRAERTHVTVHVGGDLHLDVTRADDLALEKEPAVAERRLRFRGGGAKRRGQRRGVVDDANAAPAAACRRLHDQRIAEPRPDLRRRRRVGDAVAAPRGDRDADTLGELLGGDLVAERAHDGARRSEKAHPFRGDAVGEGRVFGDEAPPRPHRVGVHDAQRADDRVLIEIGAHLGAAGGEAHRGIGVPHERRVAIDVGVEDCRAQIRALACAQRFHRAQAAHRRVAAIDDPDATDPGRPHPTPPRAGAAHAQAT